MTWKPTTISAIGRIQFVQSLLDGDEAANAPRIAVPTNTPPHTSVITWLVQQNSGVSQISGGVCSRA